MDLWKDIEGLVGESLVNLKVNFYVKAWRVQPAKSIQSENSFSGRGYASTTVKCRSLNGEEKKKYKHNLKFRSFKFLYSSISSYFHTSLSLSQS